MNDGGGQLKVKAVALMTIVFAWSISSCRSSKTIEVPKSHFVKDSNQKNKKVIVFVHGVLGDMDNTWTNKNTSSSWPDLIAKDLTMADYDVYVYGYMSPALGSASDIYEIATRFGQQLRDAGFFKSYSEIDFITHSMGGLITKRMLDTLNTPTNFNDLEKVHSVIYVSVPANGADMATLASWISENPQFKSMSPSEANNFLQTIEADWHSLLNARTAQNPYPRTFSAYETQSTSQFKVVPALYISQLSDGPTLAFDYDHSDIVKPESRTNDVYQWVRARILESSQLVSAVQPVTTTAPKSNEGPAANNPSVEVSQVAVPTSAPGIGTTYMYLYAGNGFPQCMGEFTKHSKDEWYERPSPNTPQQCLAGTGILVFKEMESDPEHILLFDGSRKVYVRLDKTELGEESPAMYRQSIDTQWGAIHLVTRQK
jgi:pimeloyl-ACP methyl ester carboxylesterase